MWRERRTLTDEQEAGGSWVWAGASGPNDNEKV